jgi:hypothetical protein
MFSPSGQSQMLRLMASRVSADGQLAGFSASNIFGALRELQRDVLRRAFARLRSVENNPAAEPTIARMTVGFSGESVQPLCACRGRVTETTAAKHNKSRAVFFMTFLA